MMEQRFETIPVKTEPEQLQGFAAQVQSLDPERDVVELAFDEVHNPAAYLGEITQPYQLIGDLLNARVASRKNLEQRLFEMEVMETQFLDYADRLRQAAPANGTEVSRRAEMWQEAIAEHRQAVMASIERRTPDLFASISDLWA